MAADGGVSFAVKLVNDVTGPAKAMQKSMRDVQKTFESTQKAMAAPAPKRGGVSDWDKAAAKARKSQVADFAREQRRMVQLNARDHMKASKIKAAAEIKEQKRVADFQKGMAQQKLDKQGGLVDFGSSLLGGGAAVMAAGVVAAGAAVAYLAYQFSKASVEAAAFGERSRLALTLLTGSATVANAEFDKVRHEAQQLGLDVLDTQAGFQKLLASQFEIGKAKELIRMSADLQAIGASADQTKRAIVAISQIKNTGYLQGDELNQLREAGVSTELVYKALGKRLNKTTTEIQKMQEKRQLGSNDVIESILEAVRTKTGSKTTGDAGKAFAASTLTGMVGVFTARLQNAFIDIGDAILPGLKRLGKLAGGFVDTVANDPKLAALGEFMLAKFEGFVTWAELNWPIITTVLQLGLEAMAAGIRFAFDLIDTSTLTGKVFIGVMGLLAVTFGLVAVAGFVLMLPLYLLIAVIGLVAFGIYKAVMWIYDSLSKLGALAGIGEGGSAAAASSYAGSIPGLQQITTAAEAGPTAKVSGALSGVTAEHVTVASQDQSATAPGHTFDFSGMQVGANVDQADLAAKIRSQVTKALTDHA